MFNSMWNLTNHDQDILKALSVKEPYATLIRDGVKSIETRSWKTNYRGPLYIHASGKTIPKEYLANDELMQLVGDRQMHFGKLVCRCELVDCVKMTDEFIRQIKRNKEEYIAGFYKVGRYAWILHNIHPVESGEIKGHLGIWTLD